MKSTFTPNAARALMLAAAPVLLLAAAPANAAVIEKKPSIQVAVPSPTGSIAGCWNANRNLYGPYNLRFCFNPSGSSGSYSVTGSGLSCNGSITWTQTGRLLRVSMTRSHCGYGQDWTADRLVCRVIPASFKRPILPSKTSGDARILVPTPTPGVASLACTYLPSVAGYRPTAFSARRA
jgi:hypothetical protein